MIHLNRTGFFFFKDAHLARYPTLCARESYLKLGLISFFKRHIQLRAGFSSVLVSIELWPYLTDLFVVI